MKLLKFIPLLFVLTLFNTNVYAAQDCDEIKGNIVGKLFCKATNKNSVSSSDGSSSVSSSDGSSEEKKVGGWTLWKKPEWMKKKN